LAANTRGIVGSLVIGFFALPRLGLHAALLVTSAAALLAAMVAWWRLDQTSTTALRVGLSATALLAWLALPQLLGTRLPQDYLAGPANWSPIARDAKPISPWCGVRARCSSRPIAGGKGKIDRHIR
jgi:hypothetical protein